MEWNQPHTSCKRRNHLRYDASVIEGLRHARFAALISGDIEARNARFLGNLQT